ncbi:MAG: hypothetical protein IKM38_04700 [Christensenellaceae bacterium]|nr:hypothetical protein [Christensenellaceae bacterium]
MADTPVLTDQTGQQILKALNENNALLGEVRQELKALGTIVTNPVFPIAATVTKKTTDENGLISIAKDDIVVHAPGAEILAAYAEQRTLVLWMEDTDSKKRYRIPFERAGVLADIMWSFTFVSNDNNNPLGEPAEFVISHVIGSTSNVSMNISPLAQRPEG